MFTLEQYRRSDERAKEFIVRQMMYELAHLRERVERLEQREHNPLKQTVMPIEQYFKTVKK